jgi:hypothetical protein
VSREVRIILLKVSIDTLPSPIRIKELRLTRVFKYDVIHCLFGTTGEAVGLVDIAFGGCDLGVSERLLDIAKFDIVRCQGNSCERVTEGVGRMVLQADRVETVTDDSGD